MTTPYATLLKNDVRTSPALQIRCTRCWAGPGRQCYTQSGKPAQWTHEVRIEAYQAVESAKK